MKRNAARFLPILLFAFMVVFFWRGLSLEPRAIPSVMIGKSLPEFRLPVLGTSGEVILFSESLKGQVALVNVWASWCHACVEEQVFLLQLARKGVPIYGLNYKDDATQAAQWLQEWGNPYRLVGSDSKGRVGIDLGVYGAPETFLIDKEGVIRYRHAGVLTQAIWEAEFLPRIQSLGGFA